MTYNTYIKSLLAVILMQLCNISIAQDITFPDKVTYIYETKDGKITSDATRIQGTTYRIDVITIFFFDLKDPAIRDLSKINTISKEFWHSQNQYHLLLGNYQDMSIAKKDLKAVRRKGFSSAKIVIYNNGLRE